jgi:hypothetical protein
MKFLGSQHRPQYQNRKGKTPETCLDEMKEEIIDEISKSYPVRNSSFFFENRFEQINVEKKLKIKMFNI